MYHVGLCMMVLELLNDITEILLKVTLNTITLILTLTLTLTLKEMVDVF